MASPLLPFALDAHRRGFRVFPLSEGQKRPVAKNWKYEAGLHGLDLPTINADWAIADYNIGILVDWFTVIDVDTVEKWNATQVRLGKPTATAEQLAHRETILAQVKAHATLVISTPHGGEHYYFASLTRGPSVDKLAIGIDTRGGGVSHVWAGSALDDRPPQFPPRPQPDFSNPYRIVHDTDKLAVLPPDLVKAINSRKTKDVPDHIRRCLIGEQYRLVEDDEPKPEPTTVLKKIWGPRDILVQVMPKPFIKGFCNPQELTFITGDPGSGKTMWAMGMGMSVAAGNFGYLKHEIAQHGPVLHLFGEGRSFIRPRFEAAMVKLGLTEEDLQGKYAIAPEMPINAKDLDARIQEAMASQYMTIPPAWIIVDTFSTFTPAVRENTDEMKPVLGLLNQIRNKYACGVMAIHHTNKQGGSRGWSGIVAAIDNEHLFTSDRVAQITTVEDSKAKDRAHSPPWAFKIIPFQDSAFLELCDVPSRVLKRIDNTSEEAHAIADVLKKAGCIGFAGKASTNHLGALIVAAADCPVAERVTRTNSKQKWLRNNRHKFLGLWHPDVEAWYVEFIEEPPV